jgi:hypothetical protein
MNRRDFKKYMQEGTALFKDPAMQKQYADQITEMARRAKAWKEENPGKVVRVQFNYSRRIFMIAPISEAVKDHFVSCNEAGLEMVKAMWPWDDLHEPTVTMVKVALELASK